MSTPTYNPDQKRGGLANAGNWTVYENSDPEAEMTAVERRGEIDLSEVGSEAAAGEIAAGIANGSETYSLTFIDYDDKLMPEQINALLAGDIETLDESIQDVFEDQRYESAVVEAKTACEARGVDYDDLDVDDQEVVRLAIEEKDDSNPVRDLARNTPDQLMRAPLGKALYDELQDRELQSLVYYDDANWEAQENGRADLLLDILSKAGVDTRNLEVREAVAGIVTEGPQHWNNATLDVIWYGEPGEAAAMPLTYSDAPDAIGRQLNFTGAHIVLLDTAQGSGMDTLIPGPMTVSVSPGAPAHLDQALPGSDERYGWDDTAGVHKPAYTPESLDSSWTNGGRTHAE